MTEQDKAQADAMLSRIETAAGEFADRSRQNAQLIAEILEAVNGLRSVFGVVRAH